MAAKRLSAAPASTRTTKPKSALTAEQQVAALVARLEPASRQLVRALRAAFRKRFPTAFELVYDYTHSLVIAFGPTERGNEATFSIATGADGTRLYFLNGPQLPDPQQVLLGKGKQVRYVPIASIATLREPAVAQLFRKASELGQPMPKAGRGRLLVKTAAKTRAAPRER